MFCLNYYPFQEYLNDVDQLKIFYNPNDRTLEDFLKKYQNKSIIIDVNDKFEQLDAKKFKELTKNYSNFKLIIDFSNKDSLKLINDYNLKFFFSNFVTTIDQLYGYLEYNPTDMYICEELGFFLDKINIILHDHNVKVRVIPNICQSSFPQTKSLLTFFIRPEDIKTYSEYVDVFEILSDKDRQAILFKIYKQGYWAGQVNQIIPTFKDTLDSKYLVDYFGAIRRNCGKRCMYKPGSCSICYRFIQLADTFKEKDIFIKKKKSI